MGQILHGTATTPPATRAKIHASKASIREIAEQHLLNLLYSYPLTPYTIVNISFMASPDSLITYAEPVG